MSKIIFYFSGTGNSYAVASAIADNLVKTELVSILQINDYATDKYSMIGFVFPVYYIHAPEIVVRLLSDVILNPSQQIFIVITHGASWGYALSDVKSLFSYIDHITIQEFRIKMPGNYILEYGGLPHFYQNILFHKANKKINHIVNTIIQNKPTKPITPNLLARLFKHNGDDKINTFHTLGAKFYTKDNCQHCGTCEKICPVNNIENSNGKIIWKDKCQQCMACIQWCPHNSITHPSLKSRRKRYTHPAISLKQLLR